jgi:hypothetical protein
MLKNNFYFLVAFVLILSNQKIRAQEDLNAIIDQQTDKKKSEKITSTFKTTRIVNSHTVETVKKGHLDFRVTHHFGDIGGANGGGHTFYGIDQAADIRIAFEYGISNKLTAGFGRNKINELLDFYLKFRLLHQTTDNKVPFSVTLFANTGFTPQKNNTGAYDHYVNRFSYVYQALIARRFSNSFSFQVMPTFFHRNYVFDPHDQNDLFYLGAGGRLKLTKRCALLADYFYSFQKLHRNNKAGYYLPLGVGFEIETGGHVFHLIFTNNGGIVENAYLADTRSSWTKMGFKFGFNISRTFSVIKPKI